MTAFRQALGLATAALAAAAPAIAATDTDQLTVTATVLSGCALTGGSLNFGQYVSARRAIST
jgi:spore coat protein U-like protein